MTERMPNGKPVTVADLSRRTYRRRKPIRLRTRLVPYATPLRTLTFFVLGPSRRRRGRFLLREPPASVAETAATRPSLHVQE